MSIRCLRSGLVVAAFYVGYNVVVILEWDQIFLLELVLSSFMWIVY